MNRFLVNAGWLARLFDKTLGGLGHFRIEVMRPLVLARFRGRPPRHRSSGV
jgi:hypothetical protein